jgi:DNA recombination protein RmuC
MTRWMEQMQTRLDRNADVLERGLKMSHESLTSRMDKTSELLGMVGERIGEVSEIGRSMKSLGDFFKSPKLRGNIGEYVLRDMLAQYLPPSQFSMQYAFKTGAIADAVVKTDSGLICIDAKFPLENYRKMHDAENEKDKDVFAREFVRDVRKHIDAISSKYILPEEHSMDYAIMYIPSESVYYEILCQRHEISEYAQQKQILMVSPSVFYAYMRVILLSLEGKKVEERARELMRNFKSLQVEFRRFSDQFILGVKHLHNAENAFTDAQRMHQVIDMKVGRLLKLDETESTAAITDPIDRQEVL